MHALLRDFDWAASSFGQPASWPEPLRTVVDLMLASAFPMCLSWGADLRLIYNDAYLSIVGQKHPAALGAKMQDVFAELWPDILPFVQRAMAGESCFLQNFSVEITRYGRPGRGWFTFSYTPVSGADGLVGGMLCIATETTEQVQMERRQSFQLRMAEQLRLAVHANEIVATTCRLLGQQLDLSRVSYLEVDEAQRQVSVRHDWTRGDLPALTGLAIDLRDFGPASEQLQQGRILKVDDVATDARTAGHSAAWASTGVRSMLAIPLVRAGALRAIVRAHRTTASAWMVEDMLLAQDAAERAWAALESADAEAQRRSAQEELHRSAGLQAFQLELSDTLRQLADADAIVAAACGLLGRHLGASRVLYAQVEDEKGTFQIRQEWAGAGVAPVSGVISNLDDLGAGIIDALRAGRAVEVDDVDQDPRTAAHARSYARVGVKSFLALPLVSSGWLNTVLVVHKGEPCHWEELDVLRTRDMAERTWSYVETARAQAALRAERDQSQQVFDSMAEGFAMLDADATVTRMNAEGLRICQLGAGDVIGRKTWEIWPGTRDSQMGGLYEQVMTTGKGGVVEYPNPLPDGRVSWLEIRAYPAVDGGLAVFFRGIDHRKLAEEKLIEADRRKDEFLATLAHELRNPLAPIAAAAELLSRGSLDAADVRRSSEVIARQVGHMTALVNDLLDMSRVTRGLASIARAPVDINQIVPEAVEQVQPIVRARGHHLAVHPFPAAAMVVGDHARLVQVLSNLLHNAAKYTPPGGNIAVRVDAQDDYVALAVRDNGIGMSSELVESAFELFSQAQRSPDRAGGGLGIGLALVKSIVELHGGAVIAHSEGPGRGSEFLVLLRRSVEREQAPIGAAESLLAAPSMKQLKVLIVDDNIDAASMLAMLMKVAGHRAWVEHEPQSALALSRTVQPDVCLLDIGLPGMDGNELARRLRAQAATAGAVLIAVTGYSQEQGGNAITPEFAHHLVKPIETSRLLAILRQIGAS